MRKAISALVVTTLASTLAGCASSGPLQSAADGTSLSSTSTTESSAAPGDTMTPSPSSSIFTAPATSSLRPSPATTSKRSTPAPKPTSTPVRSSSPSQPEPSGSTTAPSSSISSHSQPPSSLPSSFGYDPKADSKGQINAARAAARADGRKVILEFGAGWCGNCVALDETFHNSGVQAELESSYHLVQVDVDVHMDLLSQYAPNNSGGYGLPVIVVLNSNGSTVVDTDRSGNPGFDVSSFLAFLKKWAA
ncbi:thioredoxin family protein [Catenulispora rubra]|uniref:thioredoxin family protein n=1 Tax=Catenulispora rubra TaxID=280293 RepID=UPI0018920F52|nr:thioredoxin family protein [Catenulispora rubra]